jgi:hypothetical protein
MTYPVTFVTEMYRRKPQKISHLIANEIIINLIIAIRTRCMSTGLDKDYINRIEVRVTGFISTLSVLQLAITAIPARPHITVSVHSNETPW